MEDSIIPKFSKECILYFHELTRKGKCTQNTNNEMLWDDHKFQLIINVFSIGQKVG